MFSTVRLLTLVLSIIDHALAWIRGRELKEAGRAEERERQATQVADALDKAAKADVEADKAHAADDADSAFDARFRRD